MTTARTIKRYANRKLYDTRDSRYVTLDHIAAMVRAGDDVRVVENTLELVCIEEQNYAPLRWRTLQYFSTTQHLEPEPEDACTQAQAIAFCHSYLRRFS